MNDNMEAWLNELRTTNEPQADGVLYDGSGYCCLGIGEKLRGHNLDDGAGHDILASPDFIHWLGLELDERGEDIISDQDYTPYSYDIFIDYPSKEFPMRLDNRIRPTLEVSASTMNDTLDLTFAQIADMISYFGVKSVRYSR